MKSKINGYGFLEDATVDLSNPGLCGGFAPVKQIACGKMRPYAVAADHEKAHRGVWRIELLKLIGHRETHLTGEQLMVRLKTVDLAVAGKLAAKAMMGKIWRFPLFFQQHVLLFPATIFQDNRGLLYLPYMHYGRRGWKLDLCWLRYSFFYQSHRVVALY